MFQKDKHYSTDIENVILGACLLEKTAFARVYDLVKPEMFYNDGNRVVFSALQEMFNENVPTGLLTTVDFITRRKGITEIEGSNTAFFCTVKTNSVVSTADLEYQGHIIAEMWMNREIMRLTLSGVDGGKDTLENIAAIKDQLQALSLKSATSDWKDMSQLMVDLYKHQDEMKNSGGVGVLTGFEKIDTQYGGFQKGQMIVIAARPSVGKSALAGQIASNMAQKGSTVGFISLEMNNNEIAARMASLDTGINFSNIYRNLYQDENERQRFYDKIAANTVDLPIYVSDTTDVNVSDIKAKAYKLKQKNGLDCLIIDYLQLVGSEGNKNRNRENEVAIISRGIKIIAKELDIPVIILAQLNREVDKRKGADRFPMLSDLRESGAIEQDADVVMFLHSDYKSGHPLDANGNSTEGQANLVIRKWRNGDANTFIDLDFVGRLMRFEPRKYNTMPGNFRPLTKDEEPF